MSTFYRGPEEEEEETDEPETSSMSDEVADWYSRYDGYGKDVLCFELEWSVYINYMTLSSTKIPKADQKLFMLLEEYYQILQSSELSELSRKYFHFSTKDDEIQHLISENKKNLVKLDNLFERIIVERNNYAGRKGSSNFIEYVIQRDGVPGLKAYEMISNAKKILCETDFYNYIPSSRLMDPFYFINSRSFDIMNDTKKLLRKHDPVFYKQFSRIIFEDSNSFSTELLGNNTIIIRARLYSKNVVSFSNFIHELGHAKQVFDLSKEEFIKLSRYDREKLAYEYQLDMLSKYLENQEMAYIRWKLMSKIADAWFECNVHTDVVDVKQTFIESRKLLFSDIYSWYPVDYLLNLNYQKHAGESVMRALIAYENII